MLRAGQDDRGIGRATRVAFAGMRCRISRMRWCAGCGVSVAIEPAESVAGRREDEARSRWCVIRWHFSAARKLS